MLGGWLVRKVRQAPGPLREVRFRRAGHCNCFGDGQLHRLPQGRPLLHGALATAIGDVRDASEQTLAAEKRQQHGHGTWGNVRVQSRSSLWQMGSNRPPESHQAASENTMSVWE